METNVCGVNHLDSDVLLPPRKRLLACLKRQSSDINGDSNSNSNSNSIPDSPSTQNSLDQLDARISYLLKAHLSSDNPSQEEIVTASRAAAESAVKAALLARATAQAKAVVAAKAMAAAKKALEFVADVEDGQEIEQQLRKSKTKKQIDVQMLYDNNNNSPRLENGKANDEEVARKLHQAINSSPRISNCSDVKNHKQKRLKTSENGSNLENGSKAISSDHDNTIKKRGRVKQKKLPLSVCQYRDQTGPKGDVIRSPLSVGPSETGPLWKCKSFKAPACVKQNKVMQL